MGSNSVYDAQTLKIICQLHGATVAGEAERLRAHLVEIVQRKAARGAVATVENGLQITGEMDRHAVEALCLEIRRVAKQHGSGVRRFRIENADAASTGAHIARETT